MQSVVIFILHGGRLTFVNSISELTPKIDSELKSDELEFVKATLKTGVTASPLDMFAPSKTAIMNTAGLTGIVRLPMRKV